MPRHQVHEYGIAYQNYRDAQGTYQPIELGHEDADGEGFNARFSRVPRVLRLSHGGRKRLYPVEGMDSAWVELGKPDELPTLGAPTSKAGGVWTWRDWDSATQWSLRYIVGNSQVKFALRLPRKVTGLNTLTIPFSSAGLTRQGRLLLHGGIPVAELRTPTVQDAKGERRKLGVSIGAGAITLTLNDEGLTYPLVIDPPLDYQVGASANDAMVSVATTSTPPHTWTSIDLTGYDLQVGESGTNRYGCGGRFTAIALLGTDIVDVTYITFKANGTRSGTVVYSNLYGENADNAAAYSTVANYNARAKTAAIAWDSIPAWTDAVAYNTPSLVTPVTTIKNRAGWASGNAMAFEWEDDGSGNEAFRDGHSYDSAGATKVAVFHIESHAPTNNSITVGHAMGFGLGATRQTAFLRSLSHALGLAPTAVRVTTVTRTASHALGLATAVTRARDCPRDAAVALGQALSATRAIVVSRTTPAAMGLATLVARAITVTRTATAPLGYALVVTRVLDVSRTVATALGYAVTAARAIAVTRTASATMGWVASVFRDFGKNAAVAFGYHTVNLIRIKMPRRRAAAGTNRDVIGRG